MTNRSPIDWAVRPLQKYASFSGRAPRPEYWWYVLGVVLIFIVVLVLESLLGIGNMIGAYGPLSLLLSLGLVIPNLAVAIRRLHDSDRSGWWMLLTIPYLVGVWLLLQSFMTGDADTAALAGWVSLVGVILMIVLIVFLALPGTRGANRFGDDPYASETEALRD